MQVQRLAVFNFFFAVMFRFVDLSISATDLPRLFCGFLRLMFVCLFRNYFMLS